MSPAERDYSGVPLTRKLGIKEGSAVLITAEGLVHRERGPFDVIVFFALTERELRRRVKSLAAKLKPDGRLWISWPKKSSGIATDLDQDLMWEVILPTGLVDNKVVAMDERWTAFQWVWRVELRPTRAAQLGVRRQIAHRRPRC